MFDCYETPFAFLGTSSGVFGTGGGTIFGSSTNKEQDAKATATPKMPRPDLFGTPTPPQASKQGIFGAKTSSTSQEPAPPSTFKNPFAKSIQPLDGGSTATFGKPEQPASIFSGSGGGGGGGITIKRPDFLSNKPKPEAAPVFAKPSPIRNPFGASNPNAPGIPTTMIDFCVLLSDKYSKNRLCLSFLK